MHKARLLLILGVWIALLPYLGIPLYWKNILFTLSGLALAVWGYMAYKEYGAGKGTPDNFTESK